ncbi:MAG: right-handed parallel beta-helix repeat-containing protein, partial [Caldilineaceae bacterium]|nr:right-handed parallel beta-helix repeat-containing protein [Caldilineaceae bacterium]
MYSIRNLPVHRYLWLAGLILALCFAVVETRVAQAATFTVNSTVDAPDTDPNDGLCATSAGTCTLRAAIQQANATTAADTINLPAGTYAITIPPGSGDDAASGDLDILYPLTLIGAGPGATIIDAGGLDRIFEIYETGGNVTLNGLTIRNGYSAEDGGGIYNLSPGTLRLENVAITGNTTEVEGGGVHTVYGRLIISGGSVISGNTGRSGGGVYNAGELSPLGIPSRVEISNATIADNVADSGGGIYNTHEGSLTLTDVTISGNTSEDYGGGVANAGRTSLTIVRGTFTGNHAAGDGGGLFSASERPLTISDSIFTQNSAGDGDGGEGGALYTDGSGTVSVTRSTFDDNHASGEGGGVTFSSFGAVLFTESTVSNNTAETGGGINNAGATVNFSRLTIFGNRATHDGGGILNQGSGAFTLEDSNIYSNIAENGGGMSNDADGTLTVRRVTFWDNRALVGTEDDSGLGGGVYSLGDAGAVYENVTLAGNLAQVRGGGIYIDADADVHVVNTTIAYNTAPIGSGVADEGTNLNTPTPSTSVIFRNTIVAGNVGSTDCNFWLGSEGGNMDGGSSCGFSGPRDRWNVTPYLDAVADNGGHTLTMALQPESLAIDGGVAPCPLTDQRGVTRPQNGVCDSGAFEYEGPFPPPDTTPPDTFFLSGPTQDTEATSVFLFTGVDDVTAVEDLLFECRLLEFDITEIPEIPDPTQPLPPEFDFAPCHSPWQVPVIEDGMFRFEVRAIDRAGNVDPTPAVHDFEMDPDVVPPDTFFIDPPPAVTGSTAVFTFSGVDDKTPVQFLEFECRLDSNDPAAWLECTNPAVYSNLTPGQHTFQVRAADAGDNIDPTPATHTWTVGTPTTCEEANITLIAVEDGFVDEMLPLNNFGISVALLVRSHTPGANARSLVRFELPAGLPDCALERATLRLYGEGDAGRTLQAIPLAGAWQQNQVTWNNQPATTGPPATTSSGSGYREWNVTDHVAALIAGDPNHGWLIRDAVEEDAAGGEQAFRSRESINAPSTPPQLVLRFEDSGTPPPPLPTEPGATTTVFCGQVITQSTLVGNDLLNCMGEGLVIGASNIVLDLNGHTISSGLPIEPGEEDGLLAGIRNVGYDNVIVRNGTVRNYGYGVRLMAGATYNIVENMTLIGNVNAGIELLDADDGRNGNIVRNNIFQHNGFGLLITNGSENSLVEGNQFLGNGNLAIYLYDSTGHRIENNYISGVTNNPLLDSDGGIELDGSSDNQLVNNELFDTGDSGIMLREGSHRNLIVGNTSARASDAGISLDDSDYNQVLDNVLHLAGGAAIGLGNAHHNLIVGNDVRFNPGGIELGGGSSHNRIESNDASYSSADGIAVEGGESNEIVNNTINNGNAAGISLEAENFAANGNPIGGSLIAGNTTNGNLADGISVGGAGHTIANNAAHNNAAFGIRAAEGNIDGGGNTASGNGEPLQCVGVVCTPGAGVPASSADLTPPDTVILTAPPNGSSTVEPAVFTFTGSDNIAPATALIFECRLDAPPDPAPEPPEPGEPVEPPDVDNWLTCESPVTYNFLLAGEHTFEVRARDPAANVDLTPAVYTWTVVAAPPGADSTPPNTFIFEGPPNLSISTTATFRFSGSDNSTPGPYLVYQCRLDSADDSDFGACTSPITYNGLSLGEHTFEVRAVDLQGNVDPTPATRTWTIEPPPPDFTPPETTILSGPNLTTVNTNATFTFSANEEATFECSLDDPSEDEFESCTSPITYNGLSVGVHTFYVRATDLAGNDDDTPAEYTWTITPPPTAATVTCGQVVTESILLTHDLLDCLADGLVVGAPGITIDLDGYTIDGTGLGAGVRNDGFASVTVRNGTIQEFDYGVQLENGAAFNIVELLVLNLNQESGVYLADADNGVSGSIVRHNEIVGNGAGLVISETVGSLILDNLVAGNMDFGLQMLDSDHNRLEANFIVGSSDVAVILEGSSHNTLVGNTIADNPDGGLEITDASDYNRIENNYVAESGDAGIIVSHSVGNEVIGNTVREMSDSGIVLDDAHETLVYGNDVRFNNGGVELSGASNNRIEANNASSTDGVGIEVGDFSESNVIVLNLTNNNAAGGISIGGTAPAGYGNLIDRNTANNNSDTGIAVEGVGHIIIGNEANNNDGWGIYAAEGSALGVNIDGGGNRGSGNSEPEQCYNVVCNGGPPLALDQLSPETLISSGPPNTTVFNTATFDFIGFDNATAVTFQCRLDSANDADWSACTSPVTYTGLALGEHIFEVRARDWSGNIDPTPATHTWTIEPLAGGVPPETTIDSGPDATTPSTSATFAFSANEPGVTFECSLDGAPFAACSSPHSVSGLLPGQHEFQVYAIDMENLPDPTPASYVWTVTAAPVPTAVTCGQTLTQSTLLTNDLLNCLGDGLVVGASGITIDLNGRIIDGTGLGVGVRNSGFSSVTIRNGTIQEFDYGVQINGGAANNVVANLTLQQNQDGAIQLLGVQNSTVRNNHITGNTLGIELSNGATGVVVRNNTLTTNPGNAIYLLGVSGNRVEANIANGSSGAGVALEGAGGNIVIGNTLNGNSDGGVTLVLGANNNRIEANTVRDSGSDGITVSESTGNELIGNTVHQSGGSGIALEFADDNVLRGNDVRFNSSGIGLTGSSGNLIEANYASTTGGSGIEVGALSFNNTIVLNTVIGNSGEGIAIDDVAPAGQGNLIDRNNVSSNGGDGISVNGGGHTISNNTASVNGGWGIYASVTGMDGGGNRAFGNDEPTQCFNIVCEIGTWAGQPDTLLVLTPTDPTNSSTAIFTFTGIDDTTQPWELDFECRLDSTSDLAWVECENPWIYTGLSEGEHTFEVRAIDLQGNIDPTPATFTWLYTALPLGVPPDTFIDRAPPLNTPLFEGFFTFFSNEPDVTFECSLDGSPFAACGTEEPGIPVTTGVFLFEFEEFEVGPHTFQVRAIDIEGLVDPTPATYTWNILGIITTITDGPAYIAPEEVGEPAAGGETQETTATFEFEANIADVVFFCSLDLGPFVPCESGVTYTGLAVGEHLFRVYGEDDEGRTQLEPTEYGWEILPPLDETPPDTVILSGPPDPNTASGAAFTFTGSDDVTSPAGLVFQCRLDSQVEGDFADCVSPHVILPGLAAGEHTFEVRAIDAEDNIDPTPASYTWTIAPLTGNTAPPVTTIQAGPESGMSETTVTFVFAANEPDVTFECSLDGAAFVACESPFEYTGLTIGEHLFTVRGTDPDGNTEIEPPFYEWTIETPPDITPPDTLITGQPLNPSSSTAATFLFAGIDNVTPPAELDFECRLDSVLEEAFQGCESPHSYTGLSLGEHTFDVRAIDAAGNVDETPASYTWTIQVETTITAGPAAETTDTNAAFSFTASVLGATFQCALDEAAFATCAAPASYTGLAVGEHTFQVRATAPTGEIDPTPATYTWVVVAPGVIPPQTTIDSAPDNPTGSTSATFAFSSSEPGSTFECALDAEEFGACASPIEYTGLAEGEHTFRVRATDAFGITDPTPASYTWTITAAPIPTTVVCGQVLTQSTLVMNDLTNCPTNGLIIGAPGITVDLNGRTIDGLGGFGAGILNNGFDTVLITNGTIQQFAYGVQLLTGTGSNIVEGLTLSANTIAGVELSAAGDSGSGNLVRNNISTGNGYGVALVNGTQNATVRDNTINGNLSLGVYVWNSHNNRVETNAIDGATGNPALGSDAGVMLLSANDNVVLANTIVNTGDAGIIVLEGATRNRVEGNILTLTGDAGVLIEDADENLVIGNTAHQNSDAGVVLSNANGNVVRDNDLRFNEHGVEIADANDNLVELNNASDSGGAGIAVGANSFRNHIRSNIANTNGADGIYVDGDALAIDGNLVEGNTANGNAANGIHGAKAGHTLKDNTANNNAVWGILAAAGTINGGGNTASGNGQIGQCSGIVCNGPPDTPQPPNTPAGTDVTVSISTPDDAATAEVTFANVTTAGDTTIVALDSPPALPEGYLQVGSLFYDVSTTAVYAPPVTLCLSYDPSSFADPADAKLLHYEGGVWVDVTTSNDTVNGQVCGVVSSLSPFAVTVPVAPETTISSGPDAATISTSASFVFAADQPSATFECSLDGAPFASCVSPASLNNLAVGEHTFAVRATSTTGKTDATPASHTWTIISPDLTAPETLITAGPAATTTDTSATFSFTANEAGVTFECALDGAAFAGCVSPVTYTGLGAGAHSFAVRAVDSAGNTDPTPATYTWTVTTPVNCGTATTVNANSDAWIDQGSPTSNKGTDSILKVQGKSSNNNMRALVRFNLPALPAGCQVQTATLRLFAASWTNNRTIQALQVAGAWTENGVNWSDQPATTGAAATATSGSGWREWNVATQVQAMYAPGANHGFLIRDAVENSGSFEQQFHAREKGQNVPQLVISFAPATVADTTPPETLITSGPEASTLATEATFAFSTNEPGSTFECALDDAAFASCLSPLTLIELAVGQHTFRVRATDAAGNTDPTPASYTWTVTAPAPPPDTTAPVVSIDSGPADSTTETSATFEFSADEDATFACSLDGAGFEVCASPVTLTELIVGEHTFQVQATDGAGNTSTPASYTWMVEEAPPAPNTPEGQDVAVEITDPETESVVATVTFAQVDSPGKTTVTLLDSPPALPDGYLQVGASFYDIDTTAAFSGDVTICLSYDPGVFDNPAGLQLLHYEGGDWIDVTNSNDIVAGTLCGVVSSLSPFAIAAPATAEPDTTAPETTVDAGPANPTTETSATFVFSANEEATFECSLDLNPFNPCTSPAVYSDLSIGAHVFSVRATDLAGNTNAVATNYSWTIESTPEPTPVPTEEPTPVPTEEPTPEPTEEPT